jgi:hypothetical protein
MLHRSVTLCLYDLYGSNEIALLDIEGKIIVLLSLRSIALIGPSTNKDIFGCGNMRLIDFGADIGYRDYVLYGANAWGTTPLDGFKRGLANLSV